MWGENWEVVGPEDTLVNIKNLGEKTIILQVKVKVENGGFN